ncbi:MAG TPA: hypothetical protein VJ951_08335, partial [Bacteroidales bacterium]|nr:hypothetical protein [Bacteroidales bacterium]
SSFYQKFIYEYIYRRGEIKSDLHIPKMMSEWTLFLKDQKEYSEYCDDITLHLDHYEKYLTYYFYLFNNDVQSAYFANITRDQSINYIINFWEQNLK